MSTTAIASIAAQNPEVKKAISDNISSSIKAAKTTYTVGKYLIGTVVIVGGGYLVYRRFFGFTKIKEDSRFTPANITTGVAIAKANAIFNAMYGLGSGFSKVQAILLGVNHNGLIRIYNAFGAKAGFAVTPFAKRMNLFEWFGDQFKASEMAQLKQQYPYLF